MTLPELAIRRPVTTLMLLVSFVVLGAVALTRLPLAFLPDMERPRIFVRLPYPNASPDQVERLVVRPVEDSLASVRGLKAMRSWCSTDGGTVRLEFAWGFNLNLARVEVWEKLDRIRRDLPEDIEDIEVGNSWRSRRDEDSPVLEGRLSSKINLSENYELLDRKIVRPLQRVPGVARVQLDGVNPPEVHINLRLADLELHKVDVRDVSQILRSSNLNQSLGKITDGERRYTLRTVGCFVSVEEIRDLMIRPDGLRLRNVADVVYQEPPLEYGRHLDGNFAVGISVSAESSANVVDVCDRLDKRIRRLDDDPELDGVEFLVWMSQGNEIKNTLSELFFSGIFGAVLAGLVLFAFLRRFSTTLISVLCIPFSLVVTCGIVWLQGQNLNTLTLLGLIVGIGMLVDNAVVVMENIFRYQELGHDRKTAARLGSREVSIAVITATLTSVIVFLPIIFDKPNRMNIVFREIGLTVCLTLLASLFVSQTLIPLATSRLIRTRQRSRARWMVWLENVYGSVLAFNLRHRWLTPLLFVAIAASTIYPYGEVEFNFDMNSGEQHAQVNYRFGAPASLTKREEVVSQIESLLEKHRAELKTKSIYSYWNERFAMTRLYPEDGLATAEHLDVMRKRLRKILPEIAGVKVEVDEGGRHWRRDRGKRVAFQIVGDDTETLLELAGEARLRLEEIDGLSESYSGYSAGSQEIHVTLDRELVARHSVSPAQVAETVGLTFRGRRLRRFRAADGEREMRLTLDEKETESLLQLRSLPAWTDEGERVPLAALASFQELQGRRRIEREDRLTSLWVGAKYETGTKEQYLPKVKAALDDMEFPHGYSWTFGMWQQRRKERSQDFLINLSLALLLVFAVMSGLFESIQRALALMISLPFAVAGAIWALYLMEVDFGPPAAVGLLLLIGIVVNNGIVMIEHINQYQRQGIDRREAMLRGGKERLRPILMTAFTTLIGLIPIVISKPSLGNVSYYPMALVIMGGMLVSTFLTSILLPTTATLVEDGFGWCGRLFRLKS